MNRMALAVSVFSTLLPVGLAAQDVPPRTFYESLDLSTPRSAADTFLAAYARSDYETCYAALSPDAQQGFITVALARFEIARLFPIDDDRAFVQSSGLSRDAPTRDEFRNMTGVIFDDFLTTAERKAVLPFTVAPDYEAQIALVSVSPPAAVATVETHASPPVVMLELLLLPSGRWKVDRIAWEGSDPALRPWGVEPPTPDASDAP